MYNRTPMQNLARHAEPITFRADYDFRQRRRMPQAQAQASPLPQIRDPYRDQPYEREDSEISRQRGDGARFRELEGFEFVRDMSRQVEAVWRLSFKERQKAAELYREAQQCQDDPALHFAAMKALRQREQEMDKLSEESTVLLGSIFARMRRMDQRTWSHCRDYLMFERRLVPVDHPQMQEWADPRLPRPIHHQPPKPAVSAPPQAAQDDAWQELGEGATGGGGGLYERMKAKQSGRASQHGKATSQKGELGGWGTDGDQKKPEALNNSGWDACDDIDKNNADNNGNADNSWGASGGDGGDKKDADGWGGGEAGANNDQGGADWNDADNKNDQQGNDWNMPGEAKGQSAAGWDNDAAAGKSAAGNGGDNWGNEVQQDKPKTANNDQWGNNDDQQQGGGGDWGDTKSQGHQSKVKAWDDGSRHDPKSKAGWNQEPDSKSRASLPSRPRGGHGSSSERLEPVIKPYWAQWDQAQQEVQKPKVRARDAYEFPAPPTVIAPTEKPSSVSYGVQPGRGAKYTHDTYRPEYLDTMEKPYAIFTFKYRSKKALESILKRKIDTSEAQRAIEEAEREHLMRLPKDEIVQEMMKMKLAAGKGPGDHSKKPASNAGWGSAKADDNKLRPDDSVSRRDWSQKQEKKAPTVRSNGGGGWGAQGNNDAGGWDNAPAKQASAKKPQSGGGWGNDNNNGGGGDWGGAAPAGPDGGW